MSSRSVIKGLWIALAALLSLALVAAIVVVGVGWNYSNDLLEPQQPTAYDLRVIEASETSITLPRTTATARPGFFGISWETGGAAGLGDILDLQSDRVVRKLFMLRGEPPAPGIMAGLRRDVWNYNPRQGLGITYADAPIRDSDGTMYTWHVPAAAPTDTWAVVIHGKGVLRYQSMRVIPLLHAIGVTAMVTNYRNDPGTSLKGNGIYQLGMTEWQEVEKSVVYAQKRGAKHIVLMGYGMGGTIALRFLDRSKLKSMVTGVILDSPILDWKVVLDRQDERRGRSGLFAWAARRIIASRADVDWDALDFTDDTPPVPALLFHGTDDGEVPIRLSEEYAQRNRDQVTFVPVTGADHTESWNVDRERYETAIRTFLRDKVGVALSG